MHPMQMPSNPGPPVGSPPVSAPVQQQFGSPVYRQDDEAIAEAENHSRYAVSALAFNDVKTAVKELRLALEALGGA
jgi:vacuolar protein sorting-associated protein VTA1